jgi:hypothetical protein
MSFCLEDQKPQLPEPLSPLLGLSFLGISGRDLGEQFCTDGYCQGVQARMTGQQSKKATAPSSPNGRDAGYRRPRQVLIRIFGFIAATPGICDDHDPFTPNRSSR